MQAQAARAISSAALVDEARQGLNATQDYIEQEEKYGKQPMCMLLW
jgi:hypothetical protein